MRRWVWLWVVIVAVIGTAWAQAPETREFTLQWASAEEVAALFAPPLLATDAAAVERLFLTVSPEQLARQLLPPPVGMVGRWVMHVESATIGATPLRGPVGEGMGAILPEGLAGPPTASSDRNVLLATGTPDSLDKLGAILKLLDLPPKLVRLEVAVLSDEAISVEKSGIDWNMSQSEGANGEGFARTQLNPTLRAMLPTATVLTGNNRQARVQFTEVLPHYVEVNGQMAPCALVASLEVGLRPRVNADDSVTIALAFLTQAAQVGPEAEVQPYPAEQSSLSTTVRVASGETLVIGGAPSSADKALDQWLNDHPQLGTRYLRAPLLVITAKALKTEPLAAQWSTQP